MRLRLLLALIALLLVTWRVYDPVLARAGTTFVYEDGQALQANPMVRGLQPISLSLPRWLSWTTYRIDAWRGGYIWQFHATSVALHLLVGLLLYSLLTRWGANEWAVWATGLVLLHPIAVESVAYLSARSELIFAIGVLLALHCTPRADEDWTGWRLLGVLLSTYLAYGGKELGIVTPLLVCLVKPLPRWTWAIGGLVFAGAGYRILEQHAAIGVSPYPAVTAFALQCVAFVHGLRLLIWPTDLTVDADIAAASVLWQGGAVLIAGGLFVFGLRHARFLTLWLAITLGPRLVANSWEWINEHQWYVPLIGIALVIGREMPRLVEAWRVDPRVEAALAGGAMGHGYPVA